MSEKTTMVIASQADVIAHIQYDEMARSRYWKTTLIPREPWTVNRSAELQRLGATETEMELLRAAER